MIDRAWMLRALCRGLDTSLWFLETHRTVGRPRLDGIKPPDPNEPAKTVCGMCPVADDCLRYALAHAIDDGIWGATTPDERRPLAWLMAVDPDLVEAPKAVA